MHALGIGRLSRLLDGGDRGHVDPLVGLAIDAIHMPVLAAERHHGFALGVPVQHRRRADIEIKPVVGRHLVPPLERTGARVQYH